MNKSRLIQNTVKRTPELEEYYIEECDGKTQHWVHAADGYIFPETETTSICGFNAREVNKMIKNIIHESEFYGSSQSATE